jgi:DNA-binding GntR family transcriptional regulator
MEELKKQQKPKWSDELTKLCDSLAKLSQAVREIETLLDAITDKDEHDAARRMYRYELHFMQDVLQRCPWKGVS